jgi:hypothetical protein
MELTERIEDALRKSLGAEYVRLENDDGISGFVVSRHFENLSALERQEQIDNALREAAQPLSAEEQRQVLMIAGLTPLEYESVGTRIRVHRIRELNDGWIEVMLRGVYTDAQYVRGALNNQKGVTTTEPEPSPGARGVLMTFRARGTEANPLTKEKTIDLLKADPYIAVVNGSQRSSSDVAATG